MTNPRRLSPLDIPITFIKNLRNFVPIFILLLLKLQDTDGVKFWGILIILAATLIFNAVIAYLSWRKFQYSIQDDRLIIQKGVFNREEKTIYYNRIHSVNVQQPLLLRIFGAASLQIETPGGKPGSPEGELRVLKHAFALQLQQQLKQLRKKEAAVNEQGTQHIPDMSNRDVFRENQAAGDEYGDTHSHGAIPNGQSNLAGQGEVRNAINDQSHNNQQNEQWLNEEQYDYQYRISFAQLLKASLTSLNLNFAIIFILGIYSFADDVIDILMPGLYEKLIDDIIDQTSALPILLSMILVIVVLGGVWLLSIIIYLIKYGDYQITRSHEQISVSYGLLEKKSFIFDQRKVQAVIMEENPLRQLLGFAELRVQIITSDAREQLVIHPFARKKDIPSIMNQLLPDYKLELRNKLHTPPSYAFRTYALLPSIICLLLVAGAVWLWKWNGLFLLLLLPIVWGWSLICMKSSGVWLDGQDLTLRNRKINVVTYFVRRKHIVTLSLKSTPIQRKRKLHNIHVQVLGSFFSYRVKGIADEHLLPIWSWYSRNGKRKSIEQ